MKYDLKKPCDNCPFLRTGGVRLTAQRIEEIAGGILGWNGKTFACHKTTIDVEDDEGLGARGDGPETRHCAGALIFAEKNQGSTQLMRIAERLGRYNRQELMGNPAVVASVFDTIDEMKETAW